jgi:hypothetical protein
MTAILVLFLIWVVCVEIRIHALFGLFGDTPRDTFGTQNTVPENDPGDEE